MPDPISCSNPNQSTSSSYDPYSDEVGKVSRADAPNGSQPPPPAASSPAAALLVSSVPPAASVLPPPAASAPTANNNAQRTSERSGVAPYAAAGTTASGDSVFAGAALLKGRDPSTGAEAEVLSISGQLGAQNELQASLVRVGGGWGAFKGSVETMTVRANVGIHNDDGSVGLNAGVGASAIGADAAIETPTGGNVGLAASVGASGSIGLRDLDHDGKLELCARASALAYTAGICVESPL